MKRYRIPPQLFENVVFYLSKQPWGPVNQTIVSWIQDDPDGDEKTIGTDTVELVRVYLGRQPFDDVFSMMVELTNLKEHEESKEE